MLEVSNLSKSFGGVPVLRNISLRVDKGDVTAVIGPSGGGKTTLLRCLNFLERADEGQMVFGENTYNLRNVSRSAWSAGWHPEVCLHPCRAWR